MPSSLGRGSCAPVERRLPRGGRQVALRRGRARRAASRLAWRRCAERSTSISGSTGWSPRRASACRSCWLMLAVVFWLTIAGANVPSAMLAEALFWVEDQAVALFDAVGRAVVDHRIHLARRLPRPRLGGQRDAAADGDLLPAVHDPRGPRLPAARGLQPRLPVPAGGRPRQAGADDGDGLRLQRGRHHRHARHRLAARAAGRDPHQQLRALQRPLSRR